MRKIVLALLIALAPGLAGAVNLTTVTVTNGVPTAGSVTVSTLDNLLGTAGSPNTSVQTVQGISSMTPFLVAQSGTWNITNISGTVSLPTGAATSANQVTEYGYLSTIATNSGSAIPAGTNPIGYLSGFSYAHISTATTTTVKSGAGVVHTICVNTLGTVASTITVDDALTATTPTIGVINSLTLLGCQTLDVAFATGLTIVTTGTAAPDVTVSYR